ncbi:enoyl-CoA hydratase/isomerase family protein [Syntrophomonas erecta]
MPTNTVLYEKENNIGIITLNRPEVLNALNYEMMKDLNRIINIITADDDVKAVILTGGPAVFCAGADISYASKTDIGAAQDFIRLSHDTVNKLAHIDKPIVAAIAKLALGGGCELALGCDIRIAAGGSRFALPEINLGIIPGTGGTQRLAHLVGEGWAKQMILTGAAIDAETAWRIGLVTKVVPPKSLINDAKELSFDLASKPPLAIRMAKKAINYGSNVGLDCGLLFEQENAPVLFTTRDQKEGMAAFLEKRPPNFTGK